MDDLLGSEDRTVRIAELIAQSRPASKADETRDATIRVEGNGNLVAGGDIIGYGETRTLRAKRRYRRKLQARIRWHASESGRERSQAFRVSCVGVMVACLACGAMLALLALHDAGSIALATLNYGMTACALVCIGAGAYAARRRNRAAQQRAWHTREIARLERILDNAVARALH